MMKFSNALTTEEICVGSKLSSSDILWKMKIVPTILVWIYLFIYKIVRTTSLPIA